MLTSTYIHASGIGPLTEKCIWQSGITDWESFLSGYKSIRLSDRHTEILLPVVEESINRYEEQDYGYFARKLVNREHWRTFGDLGERAAYLDIETTGTYLGAGITVIGIYDGHNTKSFIRGYNLDEFPAEIEKYPLLVTYCGATFDLPHLRHAFKGTKLDQLHLDLCPALRRLGYKGGLKHIEQELGISRKDEITGLDGWDAVRLWHEWEDGSKEALDLLVAYNAADVENLKILAEFAYNNLRAQCLPVI